MTPDPATALVPPMCEDAEEYLLGAMLNNPKVIDFAADLLTGEDFYRPSYGKLFNEMVTTRSVGKAVDVATMSAVFPVEARIDIKALSGAPYITAYASDYCRDIKNASTLRSVMRAGEKMRELAATSQKSEDVLDQLEQMVFDLRSDREMNGSGAHVRDLIHAEAKRLEDSMNGIQTYHMQTHLRTVNEMVGGLEGGQFIVLAAHTGQGKTSFALNLAQHASKDKHVAFFSLEMSKLELADRIMCTMARVPSPKVKAGQITADEYADCINALGEMEQLNLYIDDTPGLSILDLQRKARRIKARHGLDLLFVDYIQLMSSGKGENRQQEIASITRQLKVLAKELEVPIIGLSQFSRQQKVAGADGKLIKRKPDLSDLRESGAIEQDADMVWFLYHKTQDSDVDFIVAKNRGGPTGERQLDFYPQYTEFRDKR